MKRGLDQILAPIGVHMKAASLYQTQPFMEI